MKSVFILGRQPALGLAELESLFGADNILPLGSGFALSSVDAKDVPFARLGGSLKISRILTWLETTNWDELQDYLVNTIPGYLKYLPEGGKLKLGISAYNMQINPKRINATGLILKKIIKTQGRSVRIVPNKSAALSSPQVIHNHLTGELGWELIFIRDGNRTLLAQTVAEQDIEAYTARDQARPKRDARVGMLPPKLAQIIINLARPNDDNIVLDPFCGTGVVLQEALLMGYSVSASDIDPRMGNYTRANLDWLASKFPKIENLSRNWQLGDATSMTWETSEFKVEDGLVVDAKRVPFPLQSIACETYLGRPFSSAPKPDVLQDVMQDVNIIHKKFLQNVARQTNAGLRMCIAIPAWRVGNSFKHLKMLDSLEELGYNRIRFAHARDDALIYHREGQFVGRELVVLERI
ncbi:MAG: hypothetical protein AAB459_04265 [Patescibacteria group bacterium]